MSSEPTYSIQHLSAEFGVSPRTLRFYEGSGLLTPAREGQSRVYAPRDRARLAWILRGKRVGFSLAEISELLDIYDLEDGRHLQREAALAMCQERVHILKRQKEDLEETLEELDGFCESLERLLVEEKTAAPDGSQRKEQPKHAQL